MATTINAAHALTGDEGEEHVWSQQVELLSCLPLAALRTVAMEGRALPELRCVITSERSERSSY